MFARMYTIQLEQCTRRVAPIHKQTCGDKGVALAKELMYFSAKLRVTGSCISITVASSCSLTFVFCLQDSKPMLPALHREIILRLA